MGFNIRQSLRLKAYCSLSSIKVLKCHLHSYYNTKLPIRGDQWGKNDVPLDQTRNWTAFLQETLEAQ